MGNAGVLPLSSWHHIPCWELGVKKVSIFLATHAQTGVSLMLSSTVGEGDGVSGMYLTATEPCYSYQDFVSSLIICLWDHFERLSFFFFFHDFHHLWLFHWGAVLQSSSYCYFEVILLHILSINPLPTYTIQI